jgi:hypothetical protein
MRHLYFSHINCDIDDDDDNGEVGGMNGFGQGKPKYSEKTCPDATLSTTNPTYQTQARTRAAAVGCQRLTASAVARPAEKINITSASRSLDIFCF